MASNNPFEESPDTTPPAVHHPQAAKEPDKPSKSLEEVAEVLLREKLVLTALELNTELLENGKEISKLRDYFSNPGNFEHVMPQIAATIKSDIGRTPSMSTFDSLELGRYSDDGRDADEKVAVLEFELRKAHDTIKSLRGSLTKASDIQSKGDEIRQNQTNKDEPLKPHEKRALNYLVHEYLNNSGSMLTAITLAEENGEQNLDDWDDVGLNIPKPPALLQQFRHYDSLSLGGHEQVNRINHLEKEISSFNSQILALKRENESLQLKMRKQSLTAPETSSSVQQLRQRLTDQTRKAFTPEAPRHIRSHDPVVVNPTTLFAEITTGSPPKQDEQRHANKASLKESTPTSMEGNNSTDSQSQSSVVSGTIPASPKSQGGSMNDNSIDKETEDNTINTDIERSGLTRQNDSAATITTSPTTPRSSVTIPEEEGEEGGPTLLPPVDDVDRNMSVAFRKELLSVVQIKINSKVGMEVSRLSDPELDVIELFSRCLPDIVPYTLLDKREVLIPVLLCVIIRHGDHKERDKLLQILFNLIKRPNEMQRQMIMSGCVAFVKLGGLVEAELFPQIWEQIDHKYYERRLLVAESCGILVPHVQPALRGSLILSVLQQMLQSDKGESVRQAVVRSLGILVSFIDDTNKFKQCWELLLTSINDTSQLVSTVALTVFLPAMAAWAYELDRLESDLILYFLEQLYTCIKQVCRSDGESGATERCQQHLVSLVHLVPWHYTSVLMSGPYAIDPSSIEKAQEVTFPQPFSHLLDVHVIIGDSSKLYKMVAGLEAEVGQSERQSWDKLTWLTKDCFEKLLKAIEALGFTQSEVLHSLSTLVSTYCAYFGHTFTNRIIKPLFQSRLGISSGDSKSNSNNAASLSTTILPVYVSGVLTAFKSDEPVLIEYLQDIIVDLSMLYAQLDSLKATILALKRDRRLHPLLVKLLHDLSTHSAVQVRCNVTTLSGLMITGVDEKLIGSHVVETLLRLASDSEMQVKIQSVESLGVVMETISNREILNGVHKQFDVFSGQTKEDFLFYETILRTLARIIPNSDPVFRDEFIIPFLTDVAAQNNEAPNLTQRRDVAHVLLEAYKGLSGCFVSMELLSSHIIVALRALVEDFGVVDQSNLSSVKQLLRDNEEKLSNHQKHLGSDATKDPSSNLLSKFAPTKMSFSFKKKT